VQWCHKPSCHLENLAFPGKLAGGGAGGDIGSTYAVIRDEGRTGERGGVVGWVVRWRCTSTNTDRATAGGQETGTEGTRFVVQWAVSQAGGAGGSTVRYRSRPWTRTGQRRTNTGQQWISYLPHGVFQQLPRPQGGQCRLFGACVGGHSTKEVRFCA
jgi:hypothetical protein